MADEINDGGPAFPETRYDERTRQEVQWTGMSLRDWYAGQFAAAWVAVLAQRRNENGYTDEGAVFEANRLGIMQADHMLKVREVPA